MLRQPTENGGLLYLKNLRPHHIHKDDRIIDPYVQEAIAELQGHDLADDFINVTRSYYTLEGHYDNLWKYVH